MPLPDPPKEPDDALEAACMAAGLDVTFTTVQTDEARQRADAQRDEQDAWARQLEPVPNPSTVEIRDPEATR